MKEQIIEQKLRNIINEDKPKHITINGKKYYISRPKIHEIKLEEEKRGGILPLIPLIIGGIAAAGSVAGGAAGIAKAVDDKKAHGVRQRELERHNKELEKIAKGGKLDDDDTDEETDYLTHDLKTKPPVTKYVGDKIKKSTENISYLIKDFINMTNNNLNVDEKKTLKQTLLLLSKLISVSKVGNGLYLNPYKKGNSIPALKESIKDFSKMQSQLNQTDKRALKNTLYNLGDHIKIEKLGDGLYLNPHRN